jgi:hypothetical protein
VNERPVVSRYGVYRDLSKSPYEYKSPYGDLFKFPSQKKLDIYTREIQTELDRAGKFVSRLHLEDVLPGEIVNLLYRSTYQALYRKVVR